MDQIIVRKSTHDFVVLNKHVFYDSNLSFKAKGLLAQIMALPDDWNYSIEGLATLAKDGKDGVRTAIHELEEGGYLIRTRQTNIKGVFLGYKYEFSDVPLLEKPSSENPTENKINTIDCKESKNNNAENANLSQEQQVVDEDFENAWSMFGRKGTKKIAKRYWLRLSKADRQSVLNAIPAYVQSTPDKAFRKHFEGWINPANRMWENEIVTHTQIPPSGGKWEPSVENIQRQRQAGAFFEQLDKLRRS